MTSSLFYNLASHDNGLALGESAKRIAYSTQVLARSRGPWGLENLCRVRVRESDTRSSSDFRGSFWDSMPGHPPLDYPSLT